MKTEFNPGAFVTFKPYEKEVQAMVTEIVPARKVTFVKDDDRIFYRLAGTNPKRPLLSTCTGNSIIESIYYKTND